MRRWGRTARFLDTDEDREKLIAEIQAVRQAVRELAENVPLTRRYEVRYQGWTLASLMAHLHAADIFSLLGIRMAAVGFPALRIDAGAPLDMLARRFFQSHRVERTLRGMAKHERKIIKFILNLPIHRFSRPIYDPNIDEVITVEQALAICFLQHWQEHLQIMQRVEGIMNENDPPTALI